MGERRLHRLRLETALAEPLAELAPRPGLASEQVVRGQDRLLRVLVGVGGDAGFYPGVASVVGAMLAFIAGLFIARVPILLFQAVQAALLDKLRWFEARAADEVDRAIEEVGDAAKGISLKDIVPGGTVQTVAAVTRESLSAISATRVANRSSSPNCSSRAQSSMRSACPPSP